jgi:hexosaminidase
VGAEGVDLEAHIDLGQPTMISTVAVTSLGDRPNWVHHSPRVEVLGSTDGHLFAELGEATDTTPSDAVVRLQVVFPAVRARYLKVHVHNQVIPAGQPGAGQPAWLFVDEIVVD